jgi:hypothetical protein
MAMAAIQADRALAAVRACNDCVLMWIPPGLAQHAGYGRPAEIDQ